MTGMITEENVPIPFPARRPAAALPPSRRLALFALCTALALPVAACTGKIGEDACFSCSAEKKADSTATAQASTPTSPVGQGVDGQTGTPRPGPQARGPGVATAPGQ